MYTDNQAIPKTTRNYSVRNHTLHVLDVVHDFQLLLYAVVESSARLHVAPHPVGKGDVPYMYNT